MGSFLDSFLSVLSTFCVLNPVLEHALPPSFDLPVQEFILVSATFHSCPIHISIFGLNSLPSKLPEKGSDNLRWCVEKQRHVAVKGSYSQGYGLPSGQVRFLELDHKEGFMPKN